MLKKILPSLLIITLFFACSKDLNLPNADLTPADLMSKEDINQILYQEIEENEIFHWDKADARLMYSAAMQSDSLFAIGYQIAGMQDIDKKIHEIDIESDQWIAARDRVLNLILEGERAIDPDKGVEDLLPHGYPKTLPSMAILMTNIETIEKLRNMEEIRYVEAMGYELPPLKNLEEEANNAVQRSSSGCGSANPNYNLNPNDYQTVYPSVKRGWNLPISNIHLAWNQSPRGAGVTIAVIDTGISDNQENLGSQFNSGLSTGRFVQKYSTKYSGWWIWRSLDPPHDQCGHGTEMAGISTAPRGSDGNSVGIAYRSNLIGIRAVEDVFISTSDEKDGVKNALILAGNRSDVKVISMSLGTPFWSGTVADGVYYAYNKGKSIFAAAGTSFSWTSGVGVIFPATMSQTYAVTGVRDVNTSSKCNTCHSGSAVDFTMVMQRYYDNSRNGLTLSMYSNQPNYVSGSSCATASVAGIAALVYSSHPGASRWTVYNAMRVNSSFYPYKNSSLGWGYVDALDAVNY